MSQSHRLHKHMKGAHRFGQINGCLCAQGQMQCTVLKRHVGAALLTIHVVR